MQKRLEPHLVGALTASAAPDFYGIGNDVAMLAVADHEPKQLMNELRGAMNAAPMKLTVVSGYDADRRITGTRCVEVTASQLTALAFGVADVLAAAVASAQARGVEFAKSPEAA